MKALEKRILYLAVMIGCIVVFASCISIKLVGGARWSSGLPLGGVDNWIHENGSIYTVADKGITSGSSYFPGIILLSLLFRIIFGYGAETAIIVSGGIVAILAFWGFSAVVSDDKKIRFWLAIIAAVFLVKEFPSARSYLLEMHPDIPALTCFLWGVIFLDKFLKARNKFYYCFSIILFWCAGLFKQNAVFLYLGLGIYALFSKAFSWRDRISIIASEFIAGIATLTVVMLIDGCWYNCITVNSLHSLLSFKEYILFAKQTWRDNRMYIIMAFIYFVLLATKNIEQKRNVEKMWFASSIGWLVFCMYGAAKDGANTGNMEAAIIAVMPFVLSTIEKMITYIRKISDISKLEKDLVNMNAKNVLRAIIFLTYIAFILVTIRPINNRVKQFNNRIKIQNEFSTWLSDNYSGKNVAYNSIVYEILNKAAVIKTTDLYTVAVWEMGGLINDEELYEISVDEEWDVIVTWPGHDETRWPKTFSGFQKVDSDQYPDMMVYYGKPVEVYVKSK